MRVRQHEFAKKIIGCSLKQVQNWRAEGMPTHPGKNHTEVFIETTEALPWVLHRFKATNAKRPEKERLSKESADQKAFSNALTRKELFKTATFFDLASPVIGAHMSDLDGVSGRLSNELAGIGDAARIRDVLGDEIRRVRNNFADGFAKLRQSTSNPEGHRGDDPPRAEENGVGVGGSSARPATRKRRTRTVEK